MAFSCAITQIDRKFKFNKYPYPAVYYALRVKLPSTLIKKKMPSTC